MVGESQISRNPNYPKLDKKTVGLLTKLCFREDDKVSQADLIFVFSTSLSIVETAKLIEKLVKNKISNKVLISGGITSNYLSGKTKISESDLVLDELRTIKNLKVDIYQEKESTNTKENVVKSLKIIHELRPRKILFVAKSHHAGRAYLTLKKFLPKITLLQATYDSKYPETTKRLNRDNWHTFDFGISRVWGEYLRITEYGKRGDIEFREVMSLVKKIEKLT